MGFNPLVVGVMIPYTLLNIFLGAWAGRHVKTLMDWVLAGRSLPFLVSVSSMYAMFFGAEIFLGSAYNMAYGGLSGDIVCDPFGGALCLVLYGLFYAKTLYKSNRLTLSDIYTERYGPKIGVLSAFIECWAYVLWTAGQITGLGIISEEVWGCDAGTGSAIAMCIVVIYTLRGGMYAVAYTELFETVVIIVSLLLVAIEVGKKTNNGLIGIYKESHETMHIDSSIPRAKGVMNHLAAWSYIGIGSIPSQDIYERMNSAKKIEYSMWASILAGLLYIASAQVPMFLGLIVRKEYGADAVANSDESIVLKLIREHASPGVTVMFYVAYFSAIISTASGTVLAAGILTTINIVRPTMTHWDDTTTLKAARVITIVFSIIAYGMSFTLDKISDFVNISSVYLMVGLFFPLTCALYWRRATAVGCALSMIGGCSVYTWVFVWSIQRGEGGFVLFDLDTSVYGNIAAAFLIFAGSLMPDFWQEKCQALADFCFNRINVCKTRGDFVIKINRNESGLRLSPRSASEGLRERTAKGGAGGVGETEVKEKVAGNMSSATVVPETGSPDGWGGGGGGGDGGAVERVREKEREGRGGDNSPTVATAAGGGHGGTSSATVVPEDGYRAPPGGDGGSSNALRANAGGLTYILTQKIAF